jgi:thioesterase domain-containing protein
MSEDITQDPEYIRGYNQAIRWEKEQEEKSKSLKSQGFRAANEELRRQRVLAIEKDLEEEGFEFQDEGIKQLQQKVKDLDARLAKLERYTKE